MTPSSPPSRSAAPPVVVTAALSKKVRAATTRRRLLVAAAADFAAVGYHGSSLTRILERAHGVTKGALYFHFVSKEAMALAVVEEMRCVYAGLAAEAEPRSATSSAADPLRRAARLVAAVSSLQLASPVVRGGERLALEGTLGEEWTSWPSRFRQDTFTRLFRLADASGDLRGGVCPETAGRTLCDVSLGAFAASLVASDPCGLADRVGQHWELVLSAIASAAWLEQWRAEGGMAATAARHPATSAWGGGWEDPSGRDLCWCGSRWPSGLG